MLCLFANVSVGVVGAVGHDEPESPPVCVVAGKPVCSVTFDVARGAFLGEEEVGPYGKALQEVFVCLLHLDEVGIVEFPDVRKLVGRDAEGFIGLVAVLDIDVVGVRGGVKGESDGFPGIVAVGDG